MVSMLWRGILDPWFRGHFDAFAQAVRELGLPPLVSAKAVQDWVRRNKVAIGLFNNFNLILIVRLLPQSSCDTLVNA